MGNQENLRMWIKSASDAIHPCHLQKFEYASGHVLRVAIVFPNFLRQQTSHIQQVHPTGGDLNSFVLPQMGAAAATKQGLCLIEGF